MRTVTHLRCPLPCLSVWGWEYRVPLYCVPLCGAGSTSLALCDPSHFLTCDYTFLHLGFLVLSQFHLRIPHDDSTPARRFRVLRVRLGPSAAALWFVCSAPSRAVWNVCAHTLPFQAQPRPAPSLCAGLASSTKAGRWDEVQRGTFGRAMRRVDGCSHFELSSEDLSSSRPGAVGKHIDFPS